MAFLQTKKPHKNPRATSVAGVTPKGQTRQSAPSADKPVCPRCGRVCGSKIGLVSHMRTHR